MLHLTQICYLKFRYASAAILRKCRIRRGLLQVISGKFLGFLISSVPNPTNLLPLAGLGPGLGAGPGIPAPSILNGAGDGTGPVEALLWLKMVAELSE